MLMDGNSLVSWCEASSHLTWSRNLFKYCESNVLLLQTVRSDWSLKVAQTVVRGGITVPGTGLVSPEGFGVKGARRCRDASLALPVGTRVVLLSRVPFCGQQRVGNEFAVLCCCCFFSCNFHRLLFQGFNSFWKTPTVEMQQRLRFVVSWSCLL